jgi:hypothetical protein
LSSKLTPKFPPSPKRKGSSGSGREIPKDKEGNDGDAPPGAGSVPSAPATPARGAFPFNFGGPNYKPLPPDAINHHTPSRSTTLLTPPSASAPGQEVNGSDDKRSSQIVYHSGFINRQPNVLPALNHSSNHFPQSSLTLSKGWKPFKVELKGSKLYFYKPPGDRNTEIKDLFPTELVPTVDGENEAGGAEDEQDGGSKNTRKPKESTTGRKKKLYWGRRTHPDLVSNDRKIDRGTSEALIHETVFAT